MMQQKNDRRRPCAAIYRPPVGRQRRFNSNSQGAQSGSSHPVNSDIDMNRFPKPVQRYNPYDPKKHNNNFRKKYTKQRDNNAVRNYRTFEKGNGCRITVPHGKKLGQIFIYKTISSFCNGPFIPFNFKFVDDDAIFYLNDQQAAREIRNMNHKVNTPDGFPMTVHIRICSLPPLWFDPGTLEMIKNIASARYDAMSHCLNIAQLHNDENMKSLGLRLLLNSSIVFSTIAKIIKEHIPELETLDLSDNKLNSLSALSSLVPVCKQLKCLSLKNNMLQSISDLNCLRGLEIHDLVLDCNPLCDIFKDRTEYIRAVQKRFPKLVSLDNVLLPAQIGFDLGTETLPVSKKSFFSADNAKEMVIQFLDQYYAIFDSGDRSKLMEAYHDEAYFSLCLSKSTPKTGGGTLGIYYGHSRNLLTIEDPSQRFKLLKQGKLDIVAALSKLPQTMHDPTSFSIDVFHISSNLMSFSVVGVFKEVGADINNATTKTFSRTYVVAPQGQGFVITNETLFIAHASQDQQSKAFKVPAPTPSPSPAPSPEGKSTNEKQLMVIELSKQTRMNLDFSTKCLEENDWDYQRAVTVFMKFQSEGKLPPEAFIPHNILDEL